jgi:5-formyltetrahydrofolate cyclo-ligase
MGSEVDLRRFILAAYERGDTLYFPAMLRIEGGAQPAYKRGKQMHFFAVTRDAFERDEPVFLSNPLELLQPGDPRLQPYPRLVPGELDMIVVPMVAFDDDDYRMGYGGGNYDGMLLDYFDTRTLVVGVAFSEQRVVKVPREAHDVRLPRIVTA